MSHSAHINNANSAKAVDLMALLGRCMGNFKVVERVISIFRVTGQADLGQLQQAIESADFPVVVQISHRFQGAAGNVSATRLRELLQHVERLAHEQNHAELLMALGQLCSEWDEFERYSQSLAPSSNNMTYSLDEKMQRSLEASHASARC